MFFTRWRVGVVRERPLRCLVSICTSNAEDRSACPVTTIPNTICTKNREVLFGEVRNAQIIENQYGKIVRKFWLQIPQRFPLTTTDEFVIMPNHIHGIVVIHDDNTVGAIHELPLQERNARRNMLLPKIIGWLKMNSAKLDLTKIAV